MSGHSKWSTIKRKKAVVDAKRGKILTKMLREITIAVKSGGPSPDGNARLKVAIQNAKMNSVPSDKIDSAIKKASGATDTDNYEEITYEGYAPNGVACLIQALTDNKNRTVADVRHALTKHGGSLGSTGSVSYLFEEKGIVRLPKEEATEDELYDIVLEAGADDVSDEVVTFAGTVLKYNSLKEEYDSAMADYFRYMPVPGDSIESAIKALSFLIFG